MLTARQQREQEYYDAFSRDKSRIEVNFDPVNDREQRPWNPYWYQFGCVKDAYKPGARLLDFGCGWGENSVVFAKMGYDVEGFDISEVNLQAARALGEKYGLADRLHFSSQTAEDLDFRDQSFDVVAGVDILHHVEIGPALAECRRVLKPGGLAIFKEPVENAVFDRVRNLGLMQRVFPKSPSFDRHITADEKKLTARDVRIIKRVFPRLEIRSFRILSRLDRFMPVAGGILEKLDYLGCLLPGFASLCGSIVLAGRR